MTLIQLLLRFSATKNNKCGLQVRVNASPKIGSQTNRICASAWNKLVAIQPVLVKRFQAAIHYPRTPKIKVCRNWCISLYNCGVHKAGKGAEGCHSPSRGAGISAMNIGYNCFTRHTAMLKNISLTSGFSFEVILDQSCKPNSYCGNVTEQEGTRLH